MFKKIKKQKKKGSILGGFSLAEVLISVAIIGLLIGVGITSVKASKERALDVDTKKTLSEIALKTAGQEIAPGIVDYQTAFSNIKAPEAITELATKLKISSSDYEYSVDSDEFAVVFPLKATSGYWCVDGKGNSKKVYSFLKSPSPINCDNTDASPLVQGPVINFGNLCIYPDAGRPRGAACYGNLGCTALGTSESAPVTALDAQDGPVAVGTFSYPPEPNIQTLSSVKSLATQIINGACGASIVTSPDQLNSCAPDFSYYRRYSVTDSDGNTTTKDLPMYTCGSSSIPF